MLWPMSAKVSRLPSGPGLTPRAVGNNRNVFARVVRAFPGRVAAMVGADEHHVVIGHQVEKFGKPLVKVLERCGIAFDVAPVTIQHVEIDEVREDNRLVTDVP